MIVALWDLDWYDGTRNIPNIDCMQLSSYLKQQNNEVIFITNKHELTYNRDALYMFRETEKSQLPSLQLLKDSGTRLVGKGFLYYNRVQLPQAIYACRPDYRLYPQLDDMWANANIVRFFCGTALIKKRQDYHNADEHSKFTIVTDLNFWAQKDEEIEWCLEALKDDEKIVFFKAISLKKILTNKNIRTKFLALDFKRGTPFKWKNDYSSEIDGAVKIVEFLKELRQYTKSAIGTIPFKAQICGDLDLDIARCFYIVDWFKQHKEKCVIIPKDESIIIFNQINWWTRTSIELSFIEYVLHQYVKTSGLEWTAILNNSIHWRHVKIDKLLEFLVSKKWSAIKPYLERQWGNKMLNTKDINYSYISRNINLLYKENYE